MPERPLRVILFGSFALSGAAGLIYESVWSHYLKLFLGHAAYAQALVLVMFMGGLGAGAWLAGRWLPRTRRLLLVYAAVELVIGVMGIGFHGVFTRVIEWTFGLVLPALGEGPGTSVFKWLVAALLVTPQALLLGATFPLMSNGVMRRFPGMPGAHVAMLYFSNSAGAAVGVLVSGFVLIPASGYPGTVLAAGVLNVLVAMLVYLAVGGRDAGHASDAGQPPARRGTPRAAPLLLAAALLTGAASFVYEIAWIRMLSMVFGASTHAFELMLATFIAGLALGGLWIRGLVDRVGDARRLLAWVQLAMGVTAALTIPLYNHTFDLMASLMQAIARTEQGYTLYSVLRGAVAMVVMLPTTVLAGATLPLLTRLLLDDGHGERSVSHVYAANTLGAIAGVLFAVGVGMPLLGLELLVAVGSMVDIGVALMLVATFGGVLAGGRVMAAAAGATAGVVLLVSTVEFDPRRMASAVYRHGVASLSATAQMLFTQDGRTATIAVWREGARVVLATNGKPDASMALAEDGAPTLDDITQTLLGALPLAVNPRARHAAVIGLGSGTSSVALLGSPHVERVDTIEIERAVVAAAQHFRPRNAAVFDDPRSHLLIEDAKTVFATRHGAYDVIVSEPSNPWVSGVASLFTAEFYAVLAASLREGGVLVQWLQLYEMDRALLGSVFAALSASFPDYALYAVTGGDLIVVAAPNGRVPAPSAEVFGFEDTGALLARVGVRDVDALRVRAIGGRALLGPLLERSGSPVNSDYFPFLDTRAPLARFLRSNDTELARSRAAPLPVVEMLAPEFRLDYPGQAREAPDQVYAERVADAYRLLELVTDGGTGAAARGAGTAFATLATTLAEDCAADPELWLATLLEVSTQTAAYLSVDDSKRLWRRLSTGCGSSARRQPWLQLLAAVGARDAGAMAALAGELLANPPQADVAQRQYLVGVAVLGLLASSRAEQASRLWWSERQRLFGDTALPFHLRVLESLLEPPG